MGGVVLLDARTVLLRADAVDITDAAIARIDAAIGDGKPPSEESESPPAPERVQEPAAPPSDQ